MAISTVVCRRVSYIFGELYGAALRWAAWAAGSSIAQLSGGPHGLQQDIILGIRPVWDLPRTLGLKCSEPGVESPTLVVVKEHFEELRPAVCRQESKRYRGAGVSGRTVTLKAKLTAVPRVGTLPAFLGQGSTSRCVTGRSACGTQAH